MRGCLLKCSSEQVRKATVLKSRQRSGQRGYVDVEAEGQPTEEPPADTRPDVNQILEAVVPTPSVLAPIPEKVVPWIQRCQKLQKQVLRYGSVSLKANQAVSRLTGMSDRAWRPIRK